MVFFRSKSAGTKPNFLCRVVSFGPEFLRLYGAADLVRKELVHLLPGHHFEAELSPDPEPGDRGKVLHDRIDLDGSGNTLRREDGQGEEDESSEPG